jgi:hypothetical protein
MSTVTTCKSAAGLLVLLAMLSLLGARWEACGDTGPRPAPGAGRSRTNDAVTHAILSGAKVPRNVFQVRDRLERKLKGKLTTFIAANRGHENPKRGAFIFFSSYTGPRQGGTVAEGELFFGFFSDKDGDTLTVRAPSGEPELLLEVIAWDYDKQMYNFWVLRGDGAKADWRFLGDSDDIRREVADVYFRPKKRELGAAVRCAICHTLGGPILKEIDAPHNDWFTSRYKLPVGPWKLKQLKAGDDPNTPANLAAHAFATADDAAHFSRQVKGGIGRLLAARAKQGRYTLKEQLRSLFCTMEINLVSDCKPYRERRAAGEAVEIPAEFFVDARLVGKKRTIPVAADVYKAALARVGSRFAPEETPGLVETRHAFFVPARSYIDNKVIDSLIDQKLLDEELVAAVLAVDFTTPIYSRERASLLHYLPAKAADAQDLRAGLVANLRAAKGKDAVARQLLANLTDPRRTAAFHRAEANAFLDRCARAATSLEAVVDWLHLAGQRRLELAREETTRSSEDNIIEPGFRLIFPEYRRQAAAGELRLDPQTARCRR